MLSMSRRTVLTAALAAGLTVPLGEAAVARTRRLVLPRPTGPYPVGVVPLHLVDRSRPDPIAGPGHHRELMAAVWYPARDVARLPRAPWLAGAAFSALLSDNDLPSDPAIAPLTAGHLQAPVRRGAGPLPVVVYSHGAHTHRSDATTMVQELASHGYLVVTVDHTLDAYSLFPDGRMIVPTDNDEYSLGSRDFADDIPFLLDRIEDLAAGRNPDVDGKRLPDGLLGAPDIGRIGMAGWSKGGTATAWLMLADRRVRAGLALDAPMEPYVETDLDRPFMLMTAEFTRAEPPVAQFWSHLTGWRLHLHTCGAAHGSYSDIEALLPQLAARSGMSDEELESWIGTLDPEQGVRIQQAYPLAFFDLHLRNRRQRLLEGPSRAFPAVRRVP